jgi:hypothetical protein
VEEHDDARAENVDKHEIGKRTYLIADVEPLDVDGVRTVAVGTALWLVALVMLLPFQQQLAENDRTWWLWTCVAGFGLGTIGWDYCRRRRRRKIERGETGPPDTSPLGAAG